MNYGIKDLRMCLRHNKEYCVFAFYYLYSFGLARGKPPAQYALALFVNTSHKGEHQVKKITKPKTHVATVAVDIVK